MSIRQLRLLRGASASTVATMIAALSHTFGGGSLPHPLLMLTVSVLLTPVAALLVGARVRLPGLAAAVTATQVVFHGVFEVVGGITASGLALGGHQHGPLVLQFNPGAADPSLISASPGMLAAHVAAAAVTAVLLWRGELLVQTIARWVRALPHAAARAVLRRRHPDSRVAHGPAGGIPAARRLRLATRPARASRIAFG